MTLYCADTWQQPAHKYDAIRNETVQNFYEYQSTALEASSMTKEQFEANDEAGQRARKEFRKALRSSGDLKKVGAQHLWAIVEAYSKMPEKIPTQPVTGALVLAGPSKRKHEQSSHTKQRPNKRAKKSTKAAAATAAKAAKEEEARQNDQHWVACGVCEKWRLVQNEITAECWQCQDDGRLCSEPEDVCNELEDEIEGL